MLERNEDRERLSSNAFRRLIDRILCQTEIDLRQQAFTVLNIGCGNGIESMDIRAACLIRDVDCRVYAIDCEQGYIAHAKATYPNDQIVFIEGNAADPTIQSTYPENANLVILRHPEVTTYMPVRNDFLFEKYQRILTIALASMDSKSKLLITTYNVIEHQILLRILATIPSLRMTRSEVNHLRDPLLERENVKAGQIDCPDQYVIVATSRKL